MNKTEQYTLLMKQGKLKEAEKIFHTVLKKVVMRRSTPLLRN